ncbi:hypothetical protein [Nesterenkonia alba]|uniref:hypothetical protein n=1 Tax=Nesterenkonia alba TaxID=515814 RepID=UPI0003FE754C|nr:hypothetical protein [Nesterenkonia alba]
MRTGGDIVSATPVQTVIERWEHGGLGVDPNGDGGVFSARAHSENGNEIDLFRGNDEINVRWDGTYTPGSNETITVIDDVENVFSYAADWATPSSNPEVVHVSWNYELEFASTVPSMVRPGGNTGASNGESYLGGTETVTDTTYSRCFYNAAPGVGQGGATSDVPREFNGVFENAGTSLPVFEGDMFAGDVAEVGFLRNARGN